MAIKQKKSDLSDDAILTLSELWGLLRNKETGQGNKF